MSKHVARKKVHKAEKLVEDAVSELDPDSDPDDEELVEEMEDTTDILNKLKQVLKDRGQTDIRKYEL